MRGDVIAFDGHSGLGTVRGDDALAYPFHCVEIADGTRAIDVGATIEFVCLPKLGTYEAGCLRAR